MGQFEHPQPHPPEDLPSFLFFRIENIINATIAITTINTIIVPIFFESHVSMKTPPYHHKYMDIARQVFTDLRYPEQNYFEVTFSFSDLDAFFISCVSLLGLNSMNSMNASTITDAMMPVTLP